MNNAVQYERETCSRCAGSGNYSYNHINGSMCFKCRGLKTTMTKRGAAAKKFADEMLAVSIADIKPGDVFTYDQKGRITVVSIELVSAGHKRKVGVEWVDVREYKVTGPKHTATFWMGQSVRLIASADQLAEIAAYQDNLTKAGSPRKRKAK